MPIWDNMPRLLAEKLGYLLCSLIILWGLRLFVARPAIADYSGKRWRSMILFKTVNIAIIIGYLLLVLNRPGMPVSTDPFLSLLMDDLLNLPVIAGYFLFFMHQSYLLHRQWGMFFSSLGSYLLEYGYLWLFVLNILLFLRIDNYYLPLMTVNFPWFNPALAETGLLGFFLLLQFGVVCLRRFKMVEAGPGLQVLVNEVAACFKIKIKQVRIWKLERINNAFSSGIFFRSIFLTESLVNSVGPEDLKMILGHECAHFKRRHLEMRVLTIAILVYLGSALLEKFPDLNWMVYSALALAAFLIYQAIARQQELRADRMAAETLGGNQNMAAALTCLLGSTSVPSKFGLLIGLLLGHPDLETRVRRLLKK